MTAGTAFVVAFVASLFAILVVLLAAYTYALLVILPKILRGLREIAKEVAVNEEDVP